MALRVYEFSKQHNMSNKDVLKILKDGGFDIQTHMAVLPDDAVTFLNSKLPGSAPKAEPKIVKTVVENKLEHSGTDNNSKTTTVNILQEKVSQSKPSISKVKIPEVAKAEVAPSLFIEPMTVADFAQKSGKPVNDVILTLLRQKIAASKNQVIPEKTVAQLAQFYGLNILEKKVTQESNSLQNIQREESGQENNGPKVHRLPVVVVIGHVDHGKTTLLDYIRKSRVASKEKGGITQHLGAYEAKTSHGGIVFLDTPGHEAFSLMRVRGIKVADIAILIIAADDGIMPQTIEALRHAKAVGLPIIVAINKVDKVSPAQVETIKRSLAQYDLIPEEWGGSTIVMPISAKTGQGVDALLDVIVLQSQMMELFAYDKVPARGYILESKIEKGRGSVATVICQHGHLKVGDYFVAGNATGKVSSLIDSFGKRVQQVGPSIPVQVAGFSELPEVGQLFQVVSAQDVKKFKSSSLQDFAGPTVSLKPAVKENAIAIIVKADNISSRDALLGAIARFSNKFDKEFYIVHSGVGSISESDVALARDTNSKIYGLHVKSEHNANLLAQKSGVEIKNFDIIYKLLEDLEQTLKSSQEVRKVLKKIGEATVLKTFDIKGLGVIAGSKINSGRFSKEGKVIVFRGKYKVGEGSISSLQRDKKNVKEVNAGFECGFLVNGFNEWQPEDRVECYLEVPAEGGPSDSSKK